MNAIAIGLTSVFGRWPFSFFNDIYRKRVVREPDYV